jgi:hypothetical protein
LMSLVCIRVRLDEEDELMLKVYTS